jgi:uncharacterized membrane protein
MGRSAFQFHSLFVPFPIVLLLGALVADLAFWVARDPLCAQAASWLVLAALIACGASLVAGLVDSSWSHAFSSAAAVLLVVINMMMREGPDAAEAVPAGPALSGFAVAILLAAGATAAERAAMRTASWRAALNRGARTFHLHHAGR